MTIYNVEILTPVCALKTQALPGKFGFCNTILRNIDLKHLSVVMFKKRFTSIF